VRHRAQHIYVVCIWEREREKERERGRERGAERERERAQQIPIMICMYICIYVSARPNQSCMFPYWYINFRKVFNLSFSTNI